MYLVISALESIETVKEEQKFFFLKTQKTFKASCQTHVQYNNVSVLFLQTKS